MDLVALFVIWFWIGGAMLPDGKIGFFKRVTWPAYWGAAVATKMWDTAK